MRQKKFTFIDLFAGIGGFRIPFEKSGGECVFTSEWDKYAQQTYLANFGDQPDGDITQIDIKKIAKHDVLLAGFPCQPFSHAGLKRGFEDSRGTLFFNIAHILDECRPSFVLLENVKRFTSHDGGRTMRTVLKTLDDLGYNVFHKVLNARDFGLPQNRERVFIVGINRRKIGDCDFNFPNSLGLPTRLGDILEKNVSDRYTISRKLWSGHKRRRRDQQSIGNGFGYSLFDEDSPYTRTMSARYYKDGSEILISRGTKNPRKITPREAARLQGFPEDFVIPVSDVQAYKQFGNSVPVPVVSAIAEEIITILLKPAARKPRELQTSFDLFKGSVDSSAYDISQKKYKQYTA